MSPCSILVDWLRYNLMIHTAALTVLVYVRAYPQSAHNLNVFHNTLIVHSPLHSIL